MISIFNAVINVWTTDPVKKVASRKSSQTNSAVVSVSNSKFMFCNFLRNFSFFLLIIYLFVFQQAGAQPTRIVQKFGNRMTPSPSASLGHEGKYTPSSSVPDLAHRFVL